MNTELRTLTDREIDSVAGGFFNTGVAINVAPNIQVGTAVAVAAVNFGGIQTAAAQVNNLALNISHATAFVL